MTPENNGHHIEQTTPPPAPVPGGRERLQWLLDVQTLRGFHSGGRDMAERPCWDAGKRIAEAQSLGEVDLVAGPRAAGIVVGKALAEARQADEVHAGAYHKRCHGHWTLADI